MRSQKTKRHLYTWPTISSLIFRAPIREIRCTEGTKAVAVRMELIKRARVNFMILPQVSDSLIDVMIHRQSATTTQIHRQPSRK
jgi:hypothetical protein